MFIKVTGKRIFMLLRRLEQKFSLWKISLLVIILKIIITIYNNKHIKNI